jgi:hypothetical protein
MAPAGLRRWERLAPHDWLSLTSSLYLALPCLIFAISWLRPVIALVLVGLVAAALLGELAPEARGDGKNSPDPNERAGGVLLLVVGVATAWTVLSGVGGVGFQAGDFLKHDAVLSALATGRWPVVLPAPTQGGSGQVALSYSIAWYLPAAVVGKVWGWRAAEFALLVWTVAGVSLALLWFARLVGSRGVVPVILFPFLGGMDLVGELITDGRLSLQGSMGEWWAGLWQFSGNTTLLSWAPQHALPAWIGTGLVCVGVGAWDREWSATLLPGALTLLWSPFAFAGLIPFAVLSFVTSRRLRRIGALDMTASLALTLVVGSYYLAHTASPENGWIWASDPSGTLLPRLLLFLLLEVGAFVALCVPEVKRLPKRMRSAFWLACLVLAVLPLYRVGHFNDLAMRASVPALMIVWSVVVRSVVYTFSRRQIVRATALGTALVLGSFVSAASLWRSVNGAQWRIPPTPSHVFHYQDEPPQVRGNYFGSLRSFFFENLARRRQESR